MKKFLYAVLIILVIVALNNDKVVGFLTYSSLLFVSCGLAFLVPALIFYAIGDFWQKHDPNYERGYLISGALKVLGLWIGGRNIYKKFK